MSDLSIEDKSGSVINFYGKLVEGHSSVTCYDVCGCKFDVAINERDANEIIEHLQGVFNNPVATRLNLGENTYQTQGYIKSVKANEMKGFEFVPIK